VVVGEALVDILPDGTEVPGGSPANVAITLGRLGEHPVIITSLAEDNRGKLVKTWLEDSGVAVIAAPPSNGRTSTAKVSLDDDGAASYQFNITWELPVGVGNEVLRTAKVLHIGSIATVLLPGAAVVEQTVTAAKAAGVYVTFDPNARPAITPDRTATVTQVENLVALADLVKTSAEDLAWYYPFEPLLSVAQRWSHLGGATVIVTRGAEGAFAVQGSSCFQVGSCSCQSQGVQTVPGIAVKVVDTIGAGDAFMGGLLKANVEGLCLCKALQFATEIAADTCTRPGADPPRHPLQIP
jgi:fructokinase